MNGLEQIAGGVFLVCTIVMRGVGSIDDFLTSLMIKAGVSDPTWQFVILIAILTFYVVLSLRAVRGIVGWGMLFFAVLLLLHHIVPFFSGSSNPFAVHIGNVF